MRQHDPAFGFDNDRRGLFHGGRRMAIELTQSDVDALSLIEQGCAPIGAHEAARLILLGYLVETNEAWISNLPATCVDTAARSIHLCMTPSAVRLLHEIRQGVEERWSVHRP